MWFRLSEIFGSRWFGNYGETPPFMWVREIERLTDNQIATGLERVAVMVNEKGQAFMPNLPEFVAQCEYVDPYPAQKALPSPEETLMEARISAKSYGVPFHETEGLTIAQIRDLEFFYRFGRKVGA